MDTINSIEGPNSRMSTLAEMERQYENHNVNYFIALLNHRDMVIRTRAVCILADISTESVVRDIGTVLRTDMEPLVRHEAAFSLGQLGYSSAIEALSDAVKTDASFFVRHEAAIALGVIGSEKARDVLNGALSDPNEEVRKSATIALANLDYAALTVKHTNGENRFIRLTGG